MAWLRAPVRFKFAYINYPGYARESPCQKVFSVSYDCLFCTRAAATVGPMLTTTRKRADSWASARTTGRTRRRRGRG